MPFQIKERGIGNGMSLLIFFSIIEGFPREFGGTWEAVATGVVSPFALIVLLVVLVGVVAGVVAMTMAARKIPVQIPWKVRGRGRTREGRRCFFPLRTNSAGVMPITFAQSIISVPGTLAAFSSFALLRSLSEVFQPNNWVFYLTYTVLIVFC